MGNGIIYASGKVEGFTVAGFFYIISIGESAMQYSVRAMYADSLFHVNDMGTALMIF